MGRKETDIDIHRKLLEGKEDWIHNTCRTKEEIVIIQQKKKKKRKQKLNM